MTQVVKACSFQGGLRGGFLQKPCRIPDPCRYGYLYKVSPQDFHRRSPDVVCNICNVFWARSLLSSTRSPYKIFEHISKRGLLARSPYKLRIRDLFARSLSGTLARSEQIFMILDPMLLHKVSIIKGLPASCVQAPYERFLTCQDLFQAPLHKLP